VVFRLLLFLVEAFDISGLIRLSLLVEVLDTLVELV
jgi:hypothetical protein